MKKELIRCLLFTTAFVILALQAVSTKAQAQPYVVSIPSLHVSANERVVGFEIHVRSGRIAQLLKVPAGWNVSVDNDASWNAVVRGSATVGAAAVELAFFTDFLVVEKNESLGIPFQAEGDVIVTKDFATERRIKIKIEDFVMQEVMPGTPR